MGLNEKNLLSKPPTLLKPNASIGAYGKVDRTSSGTLKSNPYKSSFHSAMSDTAKRSRSASNFRSQSVEPAYRKAGALSRKQSDPDIKIASNKQQRGLPKTNQRKSKSSRISVDSSDQNSEKSYSLYKSQSASLAATNANDSLPKKRQPFSFSSDFKEERPMTSPALEDVHSFLITRSYQSQPQSQRISLGNKKSDQEFKSVHFSDSFSQSIQMEISKHQNAQQKSFEQNNSEDSKNSSEKDFNLDDHDDSSSDQMDNKPNRGKMQPLPYEEGKRSLQNINEQQRPRSSASARDEQMIAKTDDLIMEVARFITQIKSSRADNFPVDMHFAKTPDRSMGDCSFESLNDSNKFNQSSASVEALTSIRCPSAVYNQSARSNFHDHSARSTTGLSISRPSSASMIRSVSNEDIHGRISLTLRMIEQEERRELQMRSSTPSFNEFSQINNHAIPNQFDSFLPPISSPVSRSASQSSIQNIAPLQETLFHSRSSLHESTPRLPKIDSPVRDERCSSRSSFNGESVRPPSRRSNSDSEVHTAHLNQSQNVVDPDKVVETDNASWETSHEKTRKIFSFLDEVEKSDRETLFVLKYDTPTQQSQDKSSNKQKSSNDFQSQSSVDGGNKLPPLQTMDSLIRKGSVELAKEHILLERNLEDSEHRIKVLEETLLHQRELNMRNLRNSERDLKKRLKLQKEEFDIAFARNEALINEMAAEKRILQERFDKLIKSFDETEEKYKEQIKSLHQKHLDEIKRLRKAQLNAENTRKQQWVGNKTQEIRELTVKGLEPEVQRIIQRHQQEMSEMRAWHADEIRETEERYQRKMSMQLQDMREKFANELEEMISREKELANKRLESELKQREDEFDAHKRRLTNELYDERERAACEEIKLKDLMQESVRKVQVKGEIEIENLKQEYESKMANMERRHEIELKTIKDVHEAEKDTWMNNYGKKYELAVKDKESQVTESLRVQMDIELREREKKLREDFDKIRKEDELVAESRLKRAQDKFQAELTEMDQSERELKTKFSHAKSELLQLEEQVFSLKTSLSMKEKQINELVDCNTKMLEERSNLTSVIRREFTIQLETLEEEVRKMRSTLLDLQTKHKLELEQSQLEVKKVSQEKDAEIDKIGARVKQTVSRKEETILELQKQLEKSNFQIQHLEQLLDQQRKDLLESMTKNSSGTGTSKRK